MDPPEFTAWQMPASLQADRAATVERGRVLFEVECAMCHGAAGNGQSPLGQTMFPPAVRLDRGRTQTKTSGQLYWLIAHGLNYTGMPAWGRDYGGPHSQEEIWALVAYVEDLGTP
jgi:mono/diheme cytochrome c family protein